MTITEAAKLYEELKPQLEELQSKLKPAEKALKEWFQKTGKNHRGKIAYSCTYPKRLDTTAVREHLGEDIHKFETRGKRETLSLIE